MNAVLNANGALSVGEEGGLNTGFNENFNVGYGSEGDVPAFATVKIRAGAVDEGIWFSTGEDDALFWVDSERTYAIFTEVTGQ